MTSFLAAAFVITLLGGLVILTGIFAFLNLLAGKARAAVIWSLGGVIAIGLLIVILGGF